MKKFYTLFLLVFFVSGIYAQNKTVVVDKAWISEAEEWSDFTYSGKIVFSINPADAPGTLSIGNYDFLYDFVDGKGKFANKATYSSAQFSNPRKVSATTDKQGVLNSTYEGTLIFQSDRDYYSVVAVITILEKSDTILGVKMRLKESNGKEYAFSTKPTS
ncbi:hypothetical protein SAMN05444671_1810 [Flavobacterium sp. CF108]|uniref:hypothetical protein n=1 Tax=unclassified Flavobacterium TaxID=196869 RepID=UPI0008CB61F4|nr:MULTISPECIES: hypothetical protein [unclassified Flavobacterium]SEN55135.1 hypothetical protein SAMN04487978_1126 [Flavobacterium sp. fv08]SHG99862.1 hypothetical protein SAMN05444671_1810 [Flavobacterium sp. CF108]